MHYLQMYIHPFKATTITTSEKGGSLASQSTSTSTLLKITKGKEKETKQNEIKCVRAAQFAVDVDVAAFGIFILLLRP